MNKNSSTALGLILAVALTTGSVLAEHPSTIGKKAPGAYSDIMIAADETKRAPAAPSSRDAKPYFFPCSFACAFAASPECILASRSWPLAVCA
jgi:hypothetical protein